MELVELKSAWQLLERLEIPKDQVGETKIENTIHSKSVSEISNIKRNLHLKFSIASLAFLASIVLALLSFYKPVLNPLQFIFSRSESALFFFAMALSMAFMLYFSYQVYARIHTIQTSALNLKENLQLFIDALKKTVTFNIWSDTILTPILASWIYYAYAFQNHSPGFDLRTALLLVVPLAMGFMAYFLEKYLQSLKFGKYIKRLSGYIGDLEK